jgi:AraC-like DNA-binding protein
LNLGTTSSVVMRALASANAPAGVLAGRVLAEFGIEVDRLADVDARVPTAALTALLERAADRVGDPHFGLRVGGSIALGALGVVDHATRFSRTVGEGLERLSRYFSLLSDDGEVVIEVAGTLARVIRRATPGDRSTHHMAEMVFALIVARGRMEVGRDWPLRRVRFVHPPVGDSREIEQFFRAPVEFSRPFDELVFDRGFLEEPLMAADQGLADVLDRYAQLLVAKRSSADVLLLRQLRETIAEALPTGAFDLGTVARPLKTSRRSLQRRLSEAGTSYADVVDDVRRELALGYLAQPSIGLTEAALLLGFSEGSAFHRAFRRWTGTTPSRYRLDLVP